MKQLIIAAVVIAGGFLAWHNIPGLRTAVSGKISELGGWSDEDRKEDPIGYIEYAKGQLEDNIAKFEEAAAEVTEEKRENEAQLEKFTRLLQVGDKSFGELKELYKRAKDTDAWPVQWSGQSYSEDELVRQVDAIMTERTDAAARAQEYQMLVEGTDDQRAFINERVRELRAAIDKLDSQKAQIRTASLTESSEQILAEVNSLVEGSNEQVATGKVLDLDAIDALARREQAAAEAERVRSERRSDVLEALNS